MSCLKYYRPTVQLKRISNKFIIKEEKIMAMEITNNYSSYAAQGMAGNTKKKETEKTQKTAEKKRNSTSTYPLGTQHRS